MEQKITWQDVEEANARFDAQVARVGKQQRIWLLVAFLIAAISVPFWKVLCEYGEGGDFVLPILYAWVTFAFLALASNLYHTRKRSGVDRADFGPTAEEWEAQVLGNEVRAGDILYKSLRHTPSHLRTALMFLWSRVSGAGTLSFEDFLGTGDMISRNEILGSKLCSCLSLSAAGTFEFKRSFIEEYILEPARVEERERTE